MFKLFKHLAFCATLLVAASASAHSFKIGDLEVIHPHARPTTPGIQNGAAWFGVKNAGASDDRVIGVESPIADHAEIHDMTMDNDVMRMFKVDGVPVPAGETVTLGKGNKLHVMLMGLKQPLKEGDAFDMTVHFEKAGSVPVQVWVEQPSAASGAKQHQDDQHDHSAH